MHMHASRYAIGTVAILLALGAVGTYAVSVSKPPRANDAHPVDVASPQPAPRADVANPIANAGTRVTKKPFGIRITPKDSPVQPERFAGYHTGTDFETTEAEQEQDVPVTAICDGSLLEKRTASGYGGIAVQTCVIGGRDVTVVYGHLKLASIAAGKGNQISVGERIGVLGRGYSVETDGERKHLHLGIHLGKAVDIRGYVSKRADLSGWVDPMTVLPR
ncbi:MAG: hypothetical protein RLZZ324_635 [Candidatus Parcubacteria bacterium]|jgi:hypothetical protein